MKGDLAKTSGDLLRFLLRAVVDIVAAGRKAHLGQIPPQHQEDNGSGAALVSAGTGGRHLIHPRRGHAVEQVRGIGPLRRLPLKRGVAVAQRILLRGERFPARVGHKNLPRLLGEGLAVGGHLRGRAAGCQPETVRILRRQQRIVKVKFAAVVALHLHVDGVEPHPVELHGALGDGHVRRIRPRDGDGHPVPAGAHDLMAAVPDGDGGAVGRTVAEKAVGAVERGCQRARVDRQNFKGPLDRSRIVAKAGEDHPRGLALSGDRRVVLIAHLVVLPRGEQCRPVVHRDLHVVAVDRASGVGVLVSNSGDLAQRELLRPDGDRTRVLHCGVAGRVNPEVDGVRLLPRVHKGGRIGKGVVRAVGRAVGDGGARRVHRKIDPVGLAVIGPVDRLYLVVDGGAGRIDLQGIGESARLIVCVLGAERGDHRAAVPFQEQLVNAAVGHLGHRAVAAVIGNSVPAGVAVRQLERIFRRAVEELPVGILHLNPLRAESGQFGSLNPGRHPALGRVVVVGARTVVHRVAAGVGPRGDLLRPLTALQPVLDDRLRRLDPVELHKRLGLAGIDAVFRRDLEVHSGAADDDKVIPAPGGAGVVGVRPRAHLHLDPHSAGRVQGEHTGGGVDLRHARPHPVGDRVGDLKRRPVGLRDRRAVGRVGQTQRVLVVGLAVFDRDAVLHLVGVCKLGRKGRLLNPVAPVHKGDLVVRRSRGRRDRIASDRALRRRLGHKGEPQIVPGHHRRAREPLRPVGKCDGVVGPLRRSRKSAVNRGAVFAAVLLYRHGDRPLFDRIGPGSGESHLVVAVCLLARDGVAASGGAPGGGVGLQGDPLDLRLSGGEALVGPSRLIGEFDRSELRLFAVVALGAADRHVGRPRADRKGSAPEGHLVVAVFAPAGDGVAVRIHRVLRQ